MSDAKQMKRIAFYSPKYHEKKLQAISKARSVSISRLVAFAVDNELQKDVPFEFDTKTPNLDDYEEYTFADAAGKILNYMKTLRVGAALDILLLLRYDIGVPDKESFLGGFQECLDKKMIESFKPPNKRNQRPHPDDYFYYRIAGQPSPRAKKMRENEYKRFLRLKKKFESEE